MSPQLASRLTDRRVGNAGFGGSLFFEERQSAEFFHFAHYFFVWTMLYCGNGDCHQA